MGNSGKNFRQFLGNYVAKPNLWSKLFFADDKASVTTRTSQFSNAAGLTGWRWELAYLYTDCMTSVCMSGLTSTIQKTALLGSEANRKVTVFGKRNVMSRDGLGLLDLLKIKFSLEEGRNTVITFEMPTWLGSH